ncbi:MAG: 50S ribosomal protein L22 [Clostridiaceae bacterium]|nr:50S ribosomal protein L22 [Clostridiaceae bacterium]
MKKEAMTKAYMQENREAILARYNAPHTKSNRPAILTKKQRKVLGVGKDLGKASVDNVRVAPRKVEIVLDTIRGKEVNEAKAILLYTKKIAAPYISKLLESAIANAVNNNGMNPDNLFVAECYTGQGMVFKRFMPAGKGSARPILKRTSNITVVVKERV